MDNKAESKVQPCSVSDIEMLAWEVGESGIHKPACAVCEAHSESGRSISLRHIGRAKAITKHKGAQRRVCGITAFGGTIGTLRWQNAVKKRETAFGKRIGNRNARRSHFRHTPELGGTDGRARDDGYRRRTETDKKAEEQTQVAGICLARDFTSNRVVGIVGQTLVQHFENKPEGKWRMDAESTAVSQPLPPQGIACQLQKRQHRRRPVKIANSSSMYISVTHAYATLPVTPSEAGENVISIS